MNKKGRERERERGREDESYLRLWDAAILLLINLRLWINGIRRT